MSIAAPDPLQPWLDALLLADGEQITTSWPANHQVPALQTVNGRTEQVNRLDHGFLVLTNQKVIFIREDGVFHKSYHADVNFPLDQIEGISFGGFIMKYVSITDPKGESIFHLTNVSNDTAFVAFRKSVYDQIAARKQEIEGLKVKDRIQVVMDFSELKDYMVHGGLSLQTVKCPNCSAPMQLPSSGNMVKCGYCGTTVYAQDVMDQVKQLIG